MRAQHEQAMGWTRIVDGAGTRRKLARRRAGMLSMAVRAGLDWLEPRVMLTGDPFGVALFTPLGANPVIVAGPGGLNGVPQMDLNGDGMGDMIVEYGNEVGALSSVAAVSALLMNADGSSREYQIARYAIPQAAPLPVIDQVVVGDINGDGRPDVAVLRNDGGSVTTHKFFVDIFLGQADGTFTAPAPISLGVSISTPTLTLFDQNGDGKTDVFLENGTAFTVYPGNGDGTFGAAVTTDLLAGFLKLANVSNASFQQDLSGDGIPDLVVSGRLFSSSAQGLFVFKGQANGKYNATPSFSDTTDNLTLLAMRQLSSDTNADIVAYSSGTVSSSTVASSMFVFRGAGNGTFTQSFHSATFAGGMPTIALGINGAKDPLLTPDLTGDGVNDMILVEGGLGTSNSVTLHILKNNGNAGFTETQQIAFTSVASYDSSRLVEDVDGDHLPDLVVDRFTASNGAEQTSIYFNHGGGVFDSTGLVPAPSGSVTAGSYPGLADVNGDGKLDLIYTGSVLEVLLNTTGRAFGPPIDTSIGRTIYLSRDQTIPPDALLDYTGDHLPDLVGYYGDNWNILASTGDGHFTTLEPPLSFGGMEVPLDPVAADINNDGKIDLIFGQSLGLTGVSAGGLMVVMNGATPPTDTAGGDFATARDLGTLTGSISLTEFVNAGANTPELSSPLDSDDFYRFTLTSAQSIHITATPAIGGQVSLVLQDSNGTGLAFSGSTPAEINASLQAGTYYIGVERAGGGDTHYRLDVEVAAITPVIGVVEGFATIASGQDSAISFGNVKVATTDTHQVFTIRNNGSLPLNLSTITFPAGFTMNGAAPASTLAPGESATLSVSMLTAAAGQYSGNIVIPSNDPLVSNFSIPVAGTVTGQVLTDLSGQFASTPALPTAMIAGDSAPLSFALSNAGPSAADGTYTVTFELEKGAAQLGKGDVLAGTVTGGIVLNPGQTTVPITGSFTVPGTLAAGTYYLAATLVDAGGDVDSNAADKTFFSGPITIGPPATHLAFLQGPPASVTAGASLGLTVEVLDSGNHVVTGENSMVTIALTGNAGGATLGGTTTAALVNGVATFSGLSLAKAGTYTLTASDGVLTTAKSGNVIVAADAGSGQLVIASQPGAAVVGGAMGPLVVDLEDQFGNVLTTGTEASAAVVLSIVAGPGGGNFGGAATLTAKASKGVATFSKETLSAAGTYTLGLSAPGVAAAQFTESITPGATHVAAPRVAASTFGQTISISSTLTSDAGKTIPFTGVVSLVDAGNTVLGTATLTATGAVKFALTGIHAGSHQVMLTYPGDLNHSAATSPAFTLVVHQATTSISLAVNAKTLVFGQGLDLMAAVKTKAAGTPTGVVTFYDGASQLGMDTLGGNGSAGLSQLLLGIAKHTVKAVYSGDTDFEGSTSSNAALAVGKDKTSVTLTPSVAGTIPHNQTFNLDVHVAVLAPGVSNVAGDSVVVMDGKKALGTLTLDGSGDATLPALSYSAAGAHTLTAVFEGDGDALAANASPLKLVIG